MIPVNVVSGFLGAGKTTAILKLFSQKTNDELWAVVVNEFGKISIDSTTFCTNVPHGKVFDISGGCICCTAKGYLNESLEEIIKTGLYTRIIIEPSGLGGIEMVSEMVQAKPTLTLRPVICLVDITGLKIPRLQLNPVYQRQIIKSDIVVFTKTDQIDNPSELNELVERFSTNFPQKRIYDKFAIGIKLLDYYLSDNKSSNPQKIFTRIDSSISADSFWQGSYTFDENTIFDAKCLTRFLMQHQSIIRAKGYIRTENGWKLMNYTVSGCTFEDCDNHPQSEIVLIAEKSEESLLENIESGIRESIHPRL